MSPVKPDLFEPKSGIAVGPPTRDQRRHAFANTRTYNDCVAVAARTMIVSGGLADPGIDAIRTDIAQTLGTPAMNWRANGGGVGVGSIAIALSGALTLHGVAPIVSDNALPGGEASMAGLAFAIRNASGATAFTGFFQNGFHTATAQYDPTADTYNISNLKGYGDIVVIPSDEFLGGFIGPNNPDQLQILPAVVSVSAVVPSNAFNFV